jgi:tetrahydromethanopterin S-methyltransferase subunit E
MPGSRRGQGRQAHKAKIVESEPRRPGTLREAWIAQPSKLMVMGVVSLAVAAYVIWKTASQLGLAQAVMWGAIAAVSVWVAFAASFYFGRWIRQR